LQSRRPVAVEHHEVAVVSMLGAVVTEVSHGAAASAAAMGIAARLAHAGAAWVAGAGVVVVGSMSAAAVSIVAVLSQHVDVERAVAVRSTPAAVSIVVSGVCAIASAFERAAAAAAAGVAPVAAGRGWQQSAPEGLWYRRDLAQGSALGAGLLPGGIPVVRLA
jgi:hypothetical protein